MVLCFLIYGLGMRVYLDIGGAGNFAFVGLHLWYLLVLLVFSFITLPVFMRKKLSVTKELKPFHLIVLTIPLMIVSILVDVVNLGGWDISFDLVIFLYGYYIFTKASLKSIVQRLLPITRALSILTTVLFVYGFMTGMPEAGNGPSILLAAVKALNCWSWLLVIFALADKKLSFSNKWLQYGNQASMPFYVLHQPVIVTLGFIIGDAAWSIPVKLVFLLTFSFIIIMAIYHFMISRISFIRILFGMKGKRKERIDHKSNVKM
jgi:glucans biosynthesis protein C